MDRKTFKEVLKLDILALDVACLEQASLYEETGGDWADAVAQRDRLKERIQAKKSEIDEKIRKNPESFGWTKDKDKITETWISNKILQNQEMIDLTEELIQTQYEVNILVVGKESLEHRSKAIGYLTDLYKGNYFAAVSKKYGILSGGSIKDAVGNAQDAQGAAMETSNRVKILKKKRGIEGDGTSS
jgi:hypothetical protein